MALTEYFSFSEKQKHFERSLKELIGRMCQAKRHTTLSVENECRYSHGQRWASVSSGALREDEIRLQQTFVDVSKSDIRNHKLVALPNFIDAIVNGLTKSLEQMMYKTIIESCHNSGQTIKKAANESPADSFLRLLKAVDFNVGKDGQISRPSIHMNPETTATFLKDIERKGQAFKDEIERVSREKEIKAIEKEERRIKRFKTA